jgi:hypothetical protein
VVHELKLARDQQLEEWRGSCLCGESLGSSFFLADLGALFDHHVFELDKSHDVRTPCPMVVWGEDGDPVWIHQCKRHLDEYRLNRRWSWDREANTVTPSLACSYCGTHGFWKNGKWKAA